MVDGGISSFTIADTEEVDIDGSIGIVGMEWYEVIIANLLDKSDTVKVYNAASTITYEGDIVGILLSRNELVLIYKNDIDDYGFAVSLGHLSYSAGWFGNLTDISVYLQGENYEISLIIQYVSKKFEHKRKEASIKNKTKDL